VQVVHQVNILHCVGSASSEYTAVQVVHTGEFISVQVVHQVNTLHCADSASGEYNTVHVVNQVTIFQCR
jgi:hypothetical protein